MPVRLETLALLGVAVLSACRPAEEPKVVQASPTLSPAAWPSQVEPPTGTPTPTAIAETPPVKEVTEPSYIWFVGSSTMRDLGERLTNYLNQLFPPPSYRVSVAGRGGYQIENLTSDIGAGKLFPTIDRVPVAPEKVKFIVVFAGTNDLFEDNFEGISSMHAETIDLFVTLAERYLNAKFIYVKPYHLKGAYAYKNQRINDFNSQFSVDQLSAEVRHRLGRLISISTVDINADLDNCRTPGCWLDDRHIGPKMLQDLADKVKAEIKP